MKEIKTAQELAEICYLMPAFPVIGTIYGEGLYPISIEGHNLLKKAYNRYLDWKAYGKNNLEENDFELIRQYIIYHIHAPIWMMNPYMDEFQENPIAILRNQALEIKDWDDVRDYLYAALDWGLYPL